MNTKQEQPDVKRRRTNGRKNPQARIGYEANEGARGKAAVRKINCQPTESSGGGEAETKSVWAGDGMYSSAIAALKMIAESGASASCWFSSVL